ncbi:sugar phosphate isomerase/epimerase [Anaerolineae bacterium CFX9]|nr:sugar phosphate isomerase/epimerase [Kamptonema cortianum]MDL1901125.1 sugar phosphate isomerase/epimerase [Anaerolineae bacterium CFX9]
MSVPAAVQLYSLREELSRDYRPVLEQVAGIGLAGVELAGVYLNGSPRETGALVRDLGMTVCSAHMPPPVGENRNQVFDTLGELETTHLVVPFFPPEQFTTRAAVLHICDILNQSAAAAREHGVTLYYHNHWWEYEPIRETGERVYKVMLENLDPSILFEVDTYWVKAGGADPAAVVRELGERVRLLHVKDGTANPQDAMVAVGSGVMDYPAVMGAASHIEWAIIELDRCETDMLEAVRASYDYLTGRGLVHGR